MTELPYFQVIGNIPKYFSKIKSAGTPNKFDYKFLKDVLGFRSNNDQRIVGILKSMEFIDSTGIPTKRYNDFRSEGIPSATLAQGVKTAYPSLFSRNVDANMALEDEVKGYVLSITGLSEKSSLTRLITSSFMELRKLGDFKKLDDKNDGSKQESKISSVKLESTPSESTDIKLTHTIVLNLPSTTNKEVYDTLFASLKENLLKN